VHAGAFEASADATLQPASTTPSRLQSPGVDSGKRIGDGWRALCPGRSSRRSPPQVFRLSFHLLGVTATPPILPQLLPSESSPGLPTVPTMRVTPERGRSFPVQAPFARQKPATEEQHDSTHVPNAGTEYLLC